MSKEPKTQPVYMIQPIELEPALEGEEQSKRMVYAPPLTGDDGEPLAFDSYGEAKAEAESRGYDYRNVTRRTVEAE